MGQKKKALNNMIFFNGHRNGEYEKNLIPFYDKKYLTFSEENLIMHIYVKPNLISDLLVKASKLAC